MRRPGWLLGRLGDPDATHSLRPPLLRQSRRASPPILALILAAVLVLAAAGGLVVFRRTPVREAAPKEISLPMADEASLLALPTDTFSLWRFSAAPRIVVAIFPTLHAQATALNRVAAFIERPNVPRDRLLHDAELGAVMGRSGEAFDTYYYGHDYRKTDLARFYATADRDHDTLNDSEQALRTRLAEAGFFADDGAAALITLPPHGGGLLDPSARATILHHELAHGAYFTDPRYAGYVEAFWTGLTEGERIAFRDFLGGEGYDAANDDLMRNETQAYLAFTADPRMFDISRTGVPEAASLRHGFIEGVPLDWLRRDADPE